jgi:hypothetical protein
VLKDEHMNQTRKYALIFAAVMPFLALAFYAGTVFCSARHEQLPALRSAGDLEYFRTDDLQYFPPGPEFKLARQVQALERARLQQQSTLNPTESANQPIGRDGKREIQLTGGVAGENDETAAETQDSSAESPTTDKELDQIDRWTRSEKHRRIMHNLGID